MMGPQAMPPMADPFLELVRITKTYPGVVALHDVSLSVSKGETIGLIGENGAGKSTLVRILGGVTEPSEGSIRVDGEDVARGKVTFGSDHGVLDVWLACGKCSMEPR